MEVQCSTQWFHYVALYELSGFNVSNPVYIAVHNFIYVHIIAQLFVASFLNVDFASPIPLNRFFLMNDLDLFKSLLLWFLVPTELRAATSTTSLTLDSEVLAEVSEYTRASISLAVFKPWKQKNKTGKE